MTTPDVVQEFMRERLRQVARHGPAEDEQHGPHDWIAFVAKHAGLAVTKPEDTPGQALDRFRKQMVCVGALSIAAIEWADRELTRLARERR